MKIHDITLLLQDGMTTYNGEPGVTVTPQADFAKGDHFRTSLISFGSHLGTHVDAPRHFIEDGVGVDQLSLEVLIGPVVVLEMPGASVNADALADIGLPPGTERVLFKTRNSERWADPKGAFIEDFVYITPQAARDLVAAGVKLVGIDYLSVEKFAAEQPETHVTLLSAGVIILEGLNLRDVSPGNYTLVALPQKLQDGDGGSTRAVLIESQLRPTDVVNG